MLRAMLAVVAISVTVTLLVGIRPCCTSANAQTQTPSPEANVWDHNGSVMYLVENGSSREFHYQKPRPGMLEAGARPGSLLFRGQVDNGQYSGTAYAGVREAVGIRRGVISGNMKVSFQAARSIG